MKTLRETACDYLVLLATFGLLAIGEYATAASQPVPSPRVPRAEDVVEGRRIYAQRCWWCHGERGLGDGPSASDMFPRPRDFVRANYKLRTTPFGALPTDQDLFRVVSAGLPGTPMPRWEQILSEEQRWQVVSYLKTFSSRFEQEQAEPIEITSELRATRESVALGEETYRRAQCVLCHGEQGRGDGGITNTLNFEWGIPHRARDLTQGWTFKGGSTARDIFTRLTTGLNGTPMGSYADLLSDEERWNLAHYVRSLDEGDPPTSQEFTITAAFVSEPLPESADAELWERIAPVMVPMGGQIIEAPPARWWSPTVNTAHIRALWNGGAVAFLIEWDDPTSGQSAHPDSALLQFPVYPVEAAGKPYFILGDADHPVDVWHWEETTEGDAAKEWFARGTSDMEMRDPIQIRATGGFENGRRWLIFSRELQTPDTDREVQFAPGQFVPLLVSIRDGANAETGNVRALSTWLFTYLERPPSTRPWLLGMAYGLGALLGGRWLVCQIRGTPA